MDFTGSKPKLEFPTKPDNDLESYGLGDSKRQQMDDNGDEMGKFFALLDRIRETNKMMKQRRPTFNPVEATSTAAENLEAQIMTKKSPWKPSFVWEDFSYGDKLFAANCGSSNVSDFAFNRASVAKETHKPDIGSEEGGKVFWVDKHRPVGSFDLNAEAPSEGSVPSGQ